MFIALTESFKQKKGARQWWHTSLIPALKRQRQEDLSSRPAWSIEWVPGQPGLHRETLSWQSNKNEEKNPWYNGIPVILAFTDWSKSSRISSFLATKGVQGQPEKRYQKKRRRIRNFFLVLMSYSFEIFLNFILYVWAFAWMYRLCT